MKVAIMGAGLAGLSCCYYLEQNKIFPDVYEKEYKVGARFANTEAIMKVLHPPVRDFKIYLQKKYGLHLNPLAPLKKLVFHGPKVEAAITGELGYITSRGNDDNSLENQLSKQIKSPIIFDSYYTLDDLAKKYDVVVVANGNGRESQRLNNWQTDVLTNLIGATVKGTFEPTRVDIWLNNLFAPGGYGYILPYDETTANIVIGVPGKNHDMDKLLNSFYKYEGFTYEFKDTFQLIHYEIGRAKKLKLGNLLFTGNAGGFILPFMGFGQFTSIISGLEAAKSIIKGTDYEKKMKLFKKDYLMSLRLRRIMEQLDDSGHDKLIRLLKIRGIRWMFSTTRVSSLKLASILAFPWGKK